MIPSIILGLGLLDNHPSLGEATRLLEILADDSKPMRVAAAKDLCNLDVRVLEQNAARIAPVMKRLLTDRDADLRFHACYILARSGVDKDGDKIAAALVLVVKNDPIGAAHQASQALIRIGGASVGPVLEGLRESREIWRRIVLIETLGGIGSSAKDAIAHLEVLVAGPDRGTSLPSAIALTAIKSDNKVAAEYLAKTISEGSLQRRFLAALHLSKHDASKHLSVPVLIEAIKSPDDGNMFYQGLMGLWQVGDKAKDATGLVEGILSKYLQKKDDFGAVLSAGVLLRIASDKNAARKLLIAKVDVLKEFLDEPDLPVKRFGVETLESVQTTASMEILATFARDDSQPKELKLYAHQVVTKFNAKEQKSRERQKASAET